MRIVAETMLSRGFAEMDVDPCILADNLEAISSGMRKLTDDQYLGALFPKEIVRIDEVGWPMEAGLVRRSGKDETGNVEEKFFFHYVPGMKWPEEATKDLVDFRLAMERLNTEAKRIALSIAKEIDNIHDCTQLSLYDAIEQGVTVTRGLRYLGRANAYTHFDRSAISADWWASHPGLVIVDNKGRECRVNEAVLDRVAVFPGKKFGGFFAGQCGYGTPHGVRDTRTNGDDRYSVVSFVHAKLTTEAAQWIHDKTELMEALERLHAL